MCSFQYLIASISYESTPICSSLKVLCLWLGNVLETKYACICETQNFIAMKDSMKKDARVCLIPDYMETHTITTYRLASDKFLRTYFPESAYGLTPSMKFKRRKR